MEYKNINFTIWDVGGRDKVRCLWRHYFRGTKGLIFVVDSKNLERISGENGAQENLQKYLQEDELKNAALLVYANKKDLSDAMTEDELTQKLGLNDLKDRKWYIQATCAVQGSGLFEGIDWLYTELTK